YDPLHRSAAERFIATDRAGKGLTGQDAAQHTDRRARVAGIELLMASAKTIKATTGDSESMIGLAGLNTERAQAGECAGTIFTGSKVLYRGDAFSERGNERNTMRDRFIARDSETALRTPRSSDLHKLCSFFRAVLDK